MLIARVQGYGVDVHMAHKNAATTARGRVSLDQIEATYTPLPLPHSQPKGDMPFVCLG